MELSAKVMSDIIVHNKYARFIKEMNRRETWDEIVDRNIKMHLDHYGEKIFGDDIVFEQFHRAYRMVREKKILPSMRSLQFAGKAIERNPSRIYNCAYAPVDNIDFFSELMFLLLGGTGVGYSVQYRHVEQLPKVRGTRKDYRRYKIGDSIEGWADAVKVLVESYFYHKSRVNFDYSDIRDKGTELVVTGGKAPGPAPLRVALAKIEGVLEGATGRYLKPIEAHDICCYIADAVLAGGIRRAAMIALFSYNDEEMMTCKSGSWWEINPQRGRANNSVILHRQYTTEEQFKEIWKKVQKSGSGEPGIYWTNNMDWGTNPCAEIALRPYQFCNLVEMNVSDVEDDEELWERAACAAFIATLQAGYTDFHYLREVWKTTTEEDALIGVGQTGIASCKKDVDLAWLAAVVRSTNSWAAKKLGINVAARTTTVKPSGTSSLVLGTSSGIHAWHNDYYLRRVKLNKDESLYKYVAQKLPMFVEDDIFSNNTAFVCMPMKAPEGAITRKKETWNELFERALTWNWNWVAEGHVRGDNFNNVSVTISLRDEDWDDCGERMWEKRDWYNGMSVLPYDGGTYQQTPFEDITEERYNELSRYLTDINMEEVVENEDNTDLSGEAACAGGACEITF